MLKNKTNFVRFYWVMSIVLTFGTFSVGIPAVEVIAASDMGDVTRDTHFVSNLSELSVYANGDIVVPTYPTLTLLKANGLKNGYMSSKTSLIEAQFSGNTGEITKRNTGGKVVVPLASCEVIVMDGNGNILSKSKNQYHTRHVVHLLSPLGSPNSVNFDENQNRDSQLITVDFSQLGQQVPVYLLLVFTNAQTNMKTAYVYYTIEKLFPKLEPVTRLDKTINGTLTREGNLIETDLPGASVAKVTGRNFSFNVGDRILPKQAFTIREIGTSLSGDKNTSGYGEVSVTPENPLNLNANFQEIDIPEEQIKKLSQKKFEELIQKCAQLKVTGNDGWKYKLNFNINGASVATSDRVEVFASISQPGGDVLESNVVSIKLNVIRELPTIESMQDLEFKGLVDTIQPIYPQAQPQIAIHHVVPNSDWRLVAHIDPLVKVSKPLGDDSKGSFAGQFTYGANGNQTVSENFIVAEAKDFPNESDIKNVFEHVDPKNGFALHVNPAAKAGHYTTTIHWTIDNTPSQ